MKNKFFTYLLLWLLSILTIFYSFDTSFALWVDINIWTSNSNSNNSSIKNEIINSLREDSSEVLNSTSTSWIWWFAASLKNQIFSIVFIIAIAVIVWIWIKMASSRWKPEEFKKAWLHFIYLIIWLFFVFASWWIVKLVTKIDIF